MSSLLEVICEYIFSGVPSNLAYDLIKAAWQKANRSSWNDLYFDALEFALGEIKPHLLRYTKDGDVSFDKELLRKVLNQDVGGSINSFSYNKLTSREFAKKLTESISEHSILQIGGNVLTSESYEQLICNLLQYAQTRFKDSILENEAVFRQALIEESQLNLTLIQNIQDYLGKNFSLTLHLLNRIDARLDEQTHLMQELILNLKNQTIDSLAKSSTVSNQRKVIRLFIASPSDVKEERDLVQEVVNELNMPGGIADANGFIIQVLDWRNALPSMGRPESVILEQLPLDIWDVFIGILWTRFGTPSGGKDTVTGRFYDSGTEEEFWNAYRAWQKTKRPYILFYRRTDSPVSLDSIDPEQFSKIKAFWKEFGYSGHFPGLVQTYEKAIAFERRIRSDLIRLISQFGKSS